MQISLIGAEYPKQRAYITHFYTDQAFIPNTFVHLTAAIYVTCRISEKQRIVAETSPDKLNFSYIAFSS